MMAHLDGLAVLAEGDARGNGMAVSLRLSSGTRIYGLPTPNVYGGDWELGPTWNYLVTGERPLLVDSGRWGTGGRLLGMIEGVGLAPRDICSIVITHGHEDHDGGVAEVAAVTGAQVRAHPIYDRLRRPAPEHAPADFRAAFPAACWRCIMPESFTVEHCRGYQRSNAAIEVGCLGEDGWHGVGDIEVVHLPGHTPDSVALIVEGEAVIVGDTVLPDITPFPSLEAQFDAVQPLLPARYGGRDHLFGVRAYLRSLVRLRAIAVEHPGLLVLPGHRLFWRGRWQHVDLGRRVDELIEHHRDRSAAVLQALSDGPRTAREVAGLLFEPRLLQGVGIRMAENEVLSHCELLVAAGDLLESGPRAFRATGSSNFESVIDGLEPA